MLNKWPKVYYQKTIEEITKSLNCTAW
jgi:hypothetical protein